MPACSPASLLTAGSPWEVQFLRDQRGVSDSAEVTSVYYDNPGEGRARRLEQCVRLQRDNYCKRLRIGRRPALLTSFLLPSGRTICSCFASPCGLLLHAAFLSCLPAQQMYCPLLLRRLQARCPPTTPACARMTWPQWCACAGERQGKRDGCSRAQIRCMFGRGGGMEWAGEHIGSCPSCCVPYLARLACALTLHLLLPFACLKVRRAQRQRRPAHLCGAKSAPRLLHWGVQVSCEMHFRCTPGDMSRLG